MRAQDAAAPAPPPPARSRPSRLCRAPGCAAPTGGCPAALWGRSQAPTWADRAPAAPAAGSLPGPSPTPGCASDRRAARSSRPQRTAPASGWPVPAAATGIGGRPGQGHTARRRWTPAASERSGRGWRGRSRAGGCGSVGVWEGPGWVSFEPPGAETRPTPGGPVTTAPGPG